MDVNRCAVRVLPDPRGTKKHRHEFEALARVGRVSKWRHPDMLTRMFSSNFFVLPRSLATRSVRNFLVLHLRQPPLAPRHLLLTLLTPLIKSGGWHAGVQPHFKASSSLVRAALDHDVVGVICNMPTGAGRKHNHSSALLQPIVTGSSPSLDGMCHPPLISSSRFVL